MNIKKFILVLFVGPYVLSIGSFGQQSKLIPPKRVFMHSLVGVQSPDFSSLNTELENNGFMKLSTSYFARGGGIYTLFPKRHLAALFNYATYSGTKTEGKNTNSARGSTVGTSIGIVLVNSPKYQLIPFGGIAYSWFGVRLSKSNNSNQTFKNYLSGGANQQHITSQGFTSNVGLHFVATPFINKKFGNSISFGLRSGYYIPINKATIWTTNGFELQGGPSINSQGFYSTFIIGRSL